jgi:hypothetical protein
MTTSEDGNLPKVVALRGAPAAGSWAVAAEVAQPAAATGEDQVMEAMALCSIPSPARACWRRSVVGAGSLSRSLKEERDEDGGLGTRRSFWPPLVALGYICCDLGAAVGMLPTGRPGWCLTGFRSLPWGLGSCG